jgi:hypothetical protein
MAAAAVNNTVQCEKKEPPMIVMVLDASGSMHGISNNIREAVNSFITQQKAMPVDGTRFSLIVFSDEASLKIDKVLIQDVQPITENEYVCNGNTALFDAISLAIDRHSNYKQVLLVIVTDGEENKSHCTYEELHRKIEQKKNVGWSFIYLANEPRVSAAGASIGINPAANNASRSNSNNVAVGYYNIPDALRRAVSGAAADYRITGTVQNLNNLNRAFTTPSTNNL